MKYSYYIGRRVFLVPGGATRNEVKGFHLPMMIEEEYWILLLLSLGVDPLRPPNSRDDFAFPNEGLTMPLVRIAMRSVYSMYNSHVWKVAGLP